jgi:SAM-dependent methyltransferase
VNRPDPPHLDDPGAAARVRRVFDDAGYTADRIQERLGTDTSSLASTPDRPVYLRRVGEDDALGVLLRMLLLDVPVARESATRHLGADALALLEEVGVVAAAGADHVDGTVRVVPHEHILIASDRFAGGHADHVAAVHRPSATLAHLTVRRQVSRALDVGTGNGIQALLISGHAERVVATDINERALVFAAFNAALNGIANVEFRAGSFFEPVEGEEFDLLVTNPPYVISPESSFLFRDGGLPRDSLSEQLLRDTPAHVAAGGFATVMISWIHGEDEDPTARPAAWLDGAGCDALVLHTGSAAPLEIAAQWNRDVRPDPDEYGTVIDRWVEYFRAEEIRMIGFGAIVLRKRSPEPGSPNWVRAIRLPLRALAASGAALEQMFAAQDYLAGLDEASPLLDERLVVSPQVVLEQELRLQDDGWALRESGVRLSTGMGFSAGLDQVTTTLIYGLDGTRTVREALPKPDESYSSEALEEMGLIVARQMLELGFLRRA